MIQWIEKRKCGEIVWSASQEGLLSLNWHFPCHISNFGSPLAWIYLKWGFLGMWNMGPMPLWWEKTAKTTQKYMWFYRALLGVLGVLSLLCTHAMGLRDWQNKGAYLYWTNLWQAKVLFYFPFSFLCFWWLFYDFCDLWQAELFDLVTLLLLIRFGLYGLNQINHQKS